MVNIQNFKKGILSAQDIFETAITKAIQKAQVRKGLGN